MSDVVRLQGDDREVALVADAALESVGPAHAAWVADARRLHVMRRDLMLQLGAARTGAEPGSAEPTGAARTDAGRANAGLADRDARTTSTSGSLSRLWWVALSVGFAAAVTGSAPMLPPRHPQDPGLIMTIAPPAIGIAALLLILTAITVPRSARGSTAVALAAMSGVLALAALAVNLFRGDALVDAGGATGVALWAIGAAGVVVGSVVLILRARISRSPADRAAADSGKAWRDAVTELRGDAKRLLRRAPADAAVQERWAGELARLEGRAPDEQLAQARELGPWGWLVWSAYDGEIALPRLLAR